MNCNIVKYFLGIDGGGTKTEFLLTDTSGKEIARLFSGASNPVSTGIENTLLTLNSEIKQICNKIEFSEISVFAGIAGAKTGEYLKHINNLLSQFGFASYGCTSDIEIALEASLKGEDGTAMIMGTGIVAYTRSGENFYRTGGRGYLIDKGGSGFHLGSDALNSAFEFIDGRGGSETILRLVEKKLGKGLEESVAEIYGGGASYIASFAPVIFEAYSLGDTSASDIIDRNAYEAAKIINAAMKNSNGKIVICGGLCSQKEILLPFLKKYIKDDALLTFLDEPVVNGAILLARRAEKC